MTNLLTRCLSCGTKEPQEFESRADLYCVDCNQTGFKMNYREEVLRNCPNFGTDSLRTKLSLGGLGVAGEAGEVADLVKKILHHEVDPSSVRDKLIKEMGDVHWYLEYLAAVLGVTTDQVLAANVAKLRARHPNGWTPQSQQAKRDEATAT